VKSVVESMRPKSHPTSSSSAAIWTVRAAIHSGVHGRRRRRERRGGVGSYRRVLCEEWSKELRKRRGKILLSSEKPSGLKCYEIQCTRPTSVCSVF
jgi:hypothetical protein